MPVVAECLLDLGAHSKVYALDMALTVSVLAGQAGLSADTVRYYERVGLLPEPGQRPATGSTTQPPSTGCA